MFSRSRALLLNDLHLGVTGLEEQPRALRGIGFIGFPLQFVPLYFVGALCQGNVRYERTVTHQDDGRNLASLNVLIAAFVDAARLVINPLAARQVACAAVTAFKQGSHQYLRAEHVFIFNKPGSGLEPTLTTYAVTTNSTSPTIHAT